MWASEEKPFEKNKVPEDLEETTEENEEIEDEDEAYYDCPNCGAQIAAPDTQCDACGWEQPEDTDD